MSIDPNTGQISWLPISGDPVNSDVTLRASDGIQQVFQRFEITLATGNEAPRIVSTPPLTARVDSVYLYAVQADDPDADALVYTIMRGPETMRINPLNGLVSWVPQRGDIGSYEIAISAYDGQLNDEQIFQRTVTPLDVKAGDRVLFGKFGGTDVKVDGEDLLILRESDILGVVEGKKKTKKSA